MPVDLPLLTAWAIARSLSRGLPAPVADRGGLRVDTGLPDERRRHVFATPDPGLVALGRAIDEPHVALKLCAPVDELAALLPSRWAMQAQSCMMVGPDANAAPRAVPLPVGYRIERETHGPVTRVRLLAADETEAARGFAAEAGGVFMYDRIATDPAHRRRGLGRALMATLLDARRDPAAVEILAATAAGRALYETLGWRMVSAYSTALIPPDR